MEKIPSPGASASLCVVLILSSFAVVQLLGPTLQFSPLGTIVGGNLDDPEPRAGFCRITTNSCYFYYCQESCVPDSRSC